MCSAQHAVVDFSKEAGGKGTDWTRGDKRLASDVRASRRAGLGRGLPGAAPTLGVFGMASLGTHGGMMLCAVVCHALLAAK